MFKIGLAASTIASSAHTSPHASHHTV